MLLFRARWLLPISRPPIPNGVIGVAGGRIAYVGSVTTAPTGFLTDLGDSVLLPGLVNVHTHLDLTVMRGLLEGLPFFSWVRTLTAARHEALTDSDLLDSARLGICEGLLAGITTYADTSPSDAAMQAMLELGVRGVAYREVFGPDPAQCDDTMAELRQTVSIMRERESPLVRAGVSPHAPYSVSDDLFRATATLAREERLPLATHIAESEDESRLVERGEGSFAEFLRAREIEVAPRARSPIALLEACAVLDADPLLIHCVRVDEADVATIGRRRLAVAHCPASNQKLAHGTAPLAELLDAGARVGLGSDSMASNDRMDLLGEARLTRESPPARGHPRLGAQKALELATLGGAGALALDRHIGSLDVGKQADIAAFAIPPASNRDLDPAEMLFSTTPRPAALVMVAGRMLVERERVLSADDHVKERASAASARLRAWKRER